MSRTLVVMYLCSLQMPLALIINLAHFSLNINLACNQGLRKIEFSSFTVAKEKLPEGLHLYERTCVGRWAAPSQVLLKVLEVRVLHLLGAGSGLLKTPQPWFTSKVCHWRGATVGKTGMKEKFLLVCHKIRHYSAELCGLLNSVIGAGLHMHRIMVV